MYMKKTQNSNGFTLVEMLVTVAIATVLSIIITSLLAVYTKSYAVFKSANRINTATIVAGERITREIKLAQSVNMGQSMFGTHPGRLTLTTTLGTTTPSTIEFYIEGETLKLRRDGVDVGALTGGDVTVERLIFSHAQNGSSEIVSIEMNISTAQGTTTRTESFFTSAMLRGTY